MDRRDFLKLSGVFSAAIMIRFDTLAKATALPLEVEAQGKLFRGTPDGKIYISGDAGKSWRLHTNFGSHVSIRDLSVNFGGQARAQLSLADHRFEMVLAKTAKGWKTG